MTTISSCPGGGGGSAAGGGAGAGAGAGLGGVLPPVCAKTGAAVTKAHIAALPLKTSLRLLPHSMFTLHKPTLLKLPVVYQ